MGNESPVTQAAVAGVVVLYNSPPDGFSTIKTYLHQVDRLYIIDNSPVATLWALAAVVDYPNLVYRHFAENVGMATALNTAAQLAIGDGYAYLLTMDDDSRAPANMVAGMVDYLNTAPADTIGILSPRHQLLTASEQPRAETQLATDVPTIMTSGNLLSLRSYQKTGPFWDDLFIDVVDHDYNLRLRTNGYRIIELSTIRLAHRLGEQKKRFGGRVRFVTHSPARNYYLVRNSLAVAIRHWRQHPGYMLTALTTIGIELAKGALLEDDRWLRVRLMVRGITDGISKRLGKLT